MFSFSVGIPSISAIPDWTTLKSAIGDWLDRDDLDTKIPFFVLLAESMFNRQLRVPDMENSVPLTMSAESGSLPSDYLAMRSIYIEGSPDRPLRGLAPTALRQEFDGTAGIPVAYCLSGGGITLVPPPSDTTTLTLDYYARIESLSDANESNWMLEKHPDLYWAASIAYAYDYLDDDMKSQKYFGYTTALIKQINDAARSDQFGAGPLVPNSTVQVLGARC